MVLKSYSFSPKEVDVTLYSRINDNLDRLQFYIYKFARSRWKDVRQAVYFHALRYFDESRGDLNSYLKKLIREMSKERHKYQCVDFIENVGNEDADDKNIGVPNRKKMMDFDAQVIDTIMREEDRTDEVAKLALQFMDRFVVLCESLMHHDTSSRYYPDVFMQACLSINSKCDNFNDICLSIYSKYAGDFNMFLSVCTDSEWSEANFSLINRSAIGSVKLVDALTGMEVSNPDLYEKLSIVGKPQSRAEKYYVVQVPYFEVLDWMCGMFDSDETTEMKFVIGNQYICRTAGGSWSTVNVTIQNMYALQRDEILTNILLSMRARLISIGPHSFYMLCPVSEYKDGMVCDLLGRKVKFHYLNITDNIVGKENVQWLQASR